MGAGSHAPEGDDDHQCIHCGRWYARAGLLPHERNCQWSETDRRMIDLEDIHAQLRAPDVDTDDHDAEDVDELPGEEIADAPGGEAPPTPEEEAPDPAPSTARTDGGPSPVPGGWEDSHQGDDELEEDVDEDDGDGCPACGSTESFPVEMLPEEAFEEVPELEQYDKVCAPCSTNENGHLSDTIEVFSGDE